MSELVKIVGLLACVFSISSLIIANTRLTTIYKETLGAKNQSIAALKGELVAEKYLIDALNEELKASRKLIANQKELIDTLQTKEHQ